MRHLISFTLLVAAALCVVACRAAVYSRPMPTASDDPDVEGIPYFLPTSQLELSISGQKGGTGKQEDVVVSSAIQLVPDRSGGFLLDPEIGVFSEQTRTIRTEDGMLTAVLTEDVGKIDEIVSSLATAASNVLVYGSSGGPESADTSRPTEDEIRALYGRVAPGTHTLSLQAGTMGNMEVPGTGGRLLMETSGLPRQALVVPADSAPYEGVYARVLRSQDVDISLLVKLPKLYADRLEQLDALEKAELAAQAALTKADTAEAQARGKLDAAKNALAAAKAKPEPQAVIKQAQEQADAAEGVLEKSMESASSAKQKHDTARKEVSDFATERGTRAELTGWKTQPPGGATASVGKRTVAVLVPDHERLVKVPLRSGSGLGTTKEELTLASGILTAYHTERPSTALEIVKIPVSLTAALLELPAKIFQLRIDQTNQQKELLEAEQELVALQGQIASQDPSHEQQLLELQMQAAILDLQKQIATLQQEIDELESGE